MLNDVENRVVGELDEREVIQLTAELIRFRLSCWGRAASSIRLIGPMSSCRSTSSSSPPAAMPLWPPG